MKVTLWGTRGSLATPGKDTERYGGNTSCVQVQGSDGTVLILDAGTGIRALGVGLPPNLRRLDILLTHLHMDHIQGLGFLGQLYRPDVEVHLWGPVSTTMDLRRRLVRYLSPPLFPVHLPEIPALIVHSEPCHDVHLGEFHVQRDRICHPGPTNGYRITEGAVTLAYLPDHEPALGARIFPMPPWLSGYDVAQGADLLIHDAQYTQAEYERCIGWGHSSLTDTMHFAQACGVKALVPFHHDPAHTDDQLDAILTESVQSLNPSFAVLPGQEGRVFNL